jgi:hypothetical protein
MATRKQKHEEAVARREAALEKERQIGLKAQKQDRERREQRRRRAEAETQRRQQSESSKILNAIFGTPQHEEN